MVIGGFCELAEDGRLYNSAAVVDADGVIARYRKTHLWDREKLIFTPGRVQPTGTGDAVRCHAVMICYNLEFSKLTRRATLDGAELNHRSGQLAAVQPARQ